MTVLSNALSILDGGLGVTSPGGKPVAIVGTCSGGTAATPVTCYTPEQVVAAGTSGPAVEDALIILNLAGGPVVFCKAATVTAAVLGGFCQSGAGSPASGTIAAGGGNTSTAVLALTGTATARCAVVIKVTTAGAGLAASPAIAISFDGGVTYLAPQVAAAGPTVIGFGLSLTITNGSFVLADTFSAVGAACPTTADAQGTSVPVFSGTPVGAFHILAVVTTAAASLTALTAEVKFSLDGGRTYGFPVGIPASGVYAIPGTGVTVTFGAGTFIAGDTFELQTAPPLFSTSSLDAALDGLAPLAGEYEFVHIAGVIDVTHAAIAKAWAIEREALGEYTFAIGGARDQATGESVATWYTALGGASPGFTGYDFGKYGDVHASHGYVASVLYPGSFFRRNNAALLSARLKSIGPDRHPGEVAAGPIAGLMPDRDASSVVHDGLTYQVLDAYRFSTTQRVLGQPRGRYFFTSRTMALANSDYSEIQRIRVMCRAATAALEAMSLYVGSSPEVKTDGTGQIAEADALVGDAEISAAMRKAVVDAPNTYATTATATVDRTVDLVATGQYKAAIRVVPKGSVNAVSTTITFARSV